MSYTPLYYHIVFAPKRRMRVINPARERELFAYIMGIISNKNGRLIRINAAYDHVHLLVGLPATLCVSDFVRDVKRASSLHISQQNLFPGFVGWAREYFACTVSPETVDSIKQYIIGQKEHHTQRTFIEEWLEILPPEERAKWEEKYFDN